MKLTSTAFMDGQPIPAKYTCDGVNVSPPLQWSGPPRGTVSFALICADQTTKMVSVLYRRETNTKSMTAD